MIKLSSLLVLILVCASLQIGRAQTNLVLNPDFEQYSHCPILWDQIAFANFWNGIDSTWHPDTSTVAGPPCMPDYENECSSSYMCCVPSNEYFRQFPHSGNGMTQVQMYFNEELTSAQIKRDYLQGRLKSVLISGHQYCVSFYTVLEQGSAYAVDHFGAFLDNGILDTTTNCGFPQTTHVPQILVTSIITDTLNWTKVQGSFTATGNERFITIGNFFDAAHTDTVSTHFGMAFSISNTWYSIHGILGI